MWDLEKGSWIDVINANSINLAVNSNISFVEIFSALSVSLICVLIITWTYKSTFQGVLYQNTYVVSLVLASLITTSIIMVISGNLVLSLGMVGALSIVRFRSAIKEPLDIIFMFWAISTGIANGIAQFQLSIITTIFISVITFILYKLPKLIEPHMLVIKFSDSDAKEISKIVKNNSYNSHILSSSNNSENGEIVFKLRPKNKEMLLKDIKAVNGVNEASIFMY